MPPSPPPPPPPPFNVKPTPPNLNNQPNKHVEITATTNALLAHTEKFFETLLNQSEIRLYLTFSDWFGTKRIYIWFKINRKVVNTIWFRVDIKRFRKDFSVCGWELMMFWSFFHWQIWTVIPLHELLRAFLCKP